ncbi:MAG: nucleoside phosphorylase [Pseudonocardia sp.]|nr:nucleoside phosphorylase [Pseudonocardia sp.]
MYRLRVQDHPIAVFYPGVGARLARGHLEDAVASGCSKFVARGGAGAIVPGMALGHVIVPSSAVRDDGSSCHYLPAGREIDTDPDAVAAALAVLQERDVPHAVGKTWTTDAPYRETRAKIRARQAEGCLTVEMETAAFLAVARHRKVRFAQFSPPPPPPPHLYAGDDASGETWDHRRWHTSSARRELFWPAASAVLRL